MLKTLKLALAGLFAAVALIACTPSDTSVAVNVAAGPDLNGGKPAKLTVFYLNSLAAFNSADYASLANDPQTALGAE